MNERVCTPAKPNPSCRFGIVRATMMGHTSGAVGVYVWAMNHRGETSVPQEPNSGGVAAVFVSSSGTSTFASEARGFIDWRDEIGGPVAGRSELPHFTERSFVGTTPPPAHSICKQQTRIDEMRACLSCSRSAFTCEPSVICSRRWE